MLPGNVAVPVVNENLFGSVTGLTVTIQGGGTLAISNTKGCLIRVGDRQTVITKNITMKGYSDNDTAVIVIESRGTFRMEEGAMVTSNDNKRGIVSAVYVHGGTFTMQGGNISSNTSYINANFSRGGTVYVEDGIFNMTGGTISNNTSIFDYGSGGVYVGNKGIFNMQGGRISDNTSKSRFSGGGGVHVNGGTFTMQAGTISNNNSDSDGGGVCIYSGTFTKTGGTIYGSDSDQSLRNISSGGQKGHAVAWGYDRWRNATAGPNDNTDGYGFWLND